jgi:hypothetical protein
VAGPRELQPDDVVVHGRSVSIHLPQAEIFTITLDNAAFQCGIFAIRSPTR